MGPTSNNFNRIGIVGLGLIGGSLGLDLQSAGYEVYGLSHKEQTVKRAKERGLAQLISTNPNILKDCGVIIMALPLHKLIHPSKKLVDCLPPNAVITDVGSVKTPILEVWQKLHPRFVGSHPMAGSIKGGVEAGQENLFKDRPWITTPDKTTDAEALKQVQEIALNIGSKWITTNVDLHDQAVALISHLPVLVSASLLKTINNNDNDELINLARLIASTGFEDTTRVGGGNPQLGVDMASNNTSKLLHALQAYRKSIEELEEIIHTGQWEQLQEELKKTQLERTTFLKR